jgi:hypothetical protein
MAQYRCPPEWSQWIDDVSEALHADNRWRLVRPMGGMLFAQGRRTVASWLRAAGVSGDIQDDYYFYCPV